MSERAQCKCCRTQSKLPFDFTMAFQPIVDLAARKVWGYEALVRGINGEGAGWVLAQVTDEVRYQFDQACRVKAIESAGHLFKSDELHLSINFMPNAVYEPAACIRSSLAAAERVGFARQRVMFEFTEDERISDPAHIRRIVEAYKSFGFITALDDFGAGYAGLGLLANFQPDLLKIDMQLIRDIDRMPARQAIVAGIAAIAQTLGIRLLAEGVESDGEVTILRAAGIALFQGYRFARPAVGRLPEVAWPGMADSEPTRQSQVSRVL